MTIPSNSGASESGFGVWMPPKADKHASGQSGPTDAVRKLRMHWLHGQDRRLCAALLEGDPTGTDGSWPLAPSTVPTWGLASEKRARAGLRSLQPRALRQRPTQRRERQTRHLGRHLCRALGLAAAIAKPRVEVENGDLTSEATVSIKPMLVGKKLV